MMHLTKSCVHQQNEAKLTKATATLRQVTTLPGLPKNVRSSVWNALKLLDDEKVSLGLRAVNAISSLDGVGQEPSLPSYARVEIWSAVSDLESIRD